MTLVTTAQTGGGRFHFHGDDGRTLCGRSITDATYSTAGGARYHTACFLCSVCKTTITSAVEKEGSSLVCAECVSLPACKRCAKPIAVKAPFVSPDDKTKYHSGTCTTCAKCKAKLDLNDVFFLQGDLHCKPCAESLQ